jgi:hypothetical protein
MDDRNMNRVNSNLYIHPRQTRGRTAMLIRLTKQLTEERLAAIVSIKQIIADLEQHQP